MNGKIKNTLMVGALTVITTTPIFTKAQPSQLFQNINEKYQFITQVKTTKNTQESPSDSSIEFKGVHKVDGKYYLMNEETQTFKNVTFETGVTGDTFIETIKVNKQDGGMFYFNMDLNGPTDSVIEITVNGKSYLNREVQTGTDSAPIRLSLPEGDNVIKIEYQVGGLDVVNKGESFLKLTDLKYIGHNKLNTAIEYQLVDSEEWITYNDGIEFDWYQHQPIELKARYTDEQGQPQAYSTTVETPMPIAPIVSVSKSGNVEVNMFNYIDNRYKETLVRFNDGEWVPYNGPFPAEFIGNKTKIEVKVTNQFGQTIQLAPQIFTRPKLGSVTVDKVDNFIVLNYEGSQIGRPYLQYRINDGAWTTYEKPFELTFTSQTATIETRVKDEYGQVVEGITETFDAPTVELPSLDYSDRFVTIKNGTSLAKQLIEQASFDSMPTWLTFDRDIYYDSNTGEDVETYSLPTQGDWSILNGELSSPTINDGSSHELSWTFNAKSTQTFGFTFKQLASFGLTEGSLQIKVNNQVVETKDVTTQWQRIENIVLQEGENTITISYQNSSSATAPTQLIFDEFNLSEVKEIENSQVYYRINGEHWVLYDESIKIYYTDWKEDGVLIESVAVNEHGVASEIKELKLDKSQQPEMVKPSILSVRLNLSRPKTHDNIIFWIDGDFEDESIDFEECEITGDYQEVYTEAGEKTVYIRIKDDRGLWSDPVEYTFNVEEAVAPVIDKLELINTRPVTGEAISFDYKYLIDSGAYINKIEWGGDNANRYTEPGEKIVTLRVQDTRGLWSETKTLKFYVYEANPIKPTLTFSQPTLVVEKGEIPNFLEGISINNGTAKNVSYKVLSDDFNPNEVGIQVVRYEITYTQDNEEHTTIVEREVQVKAPAVNPTFKFPSLTITQGETPNFKDAIIDNGTATDIKYSLISESFDKNKTGKQTVRYYVTFKQDGKEQSMYVEREIEVKKKEIVHPTFKFPTLTTTQGETPNFKDAKITEGSAKNIRYSLISETFNKNKVGKQTVRYFVKYEINGKEYSMYVERQITVKAKVIHPTLKFPKLTVTQGETPNFKDAKITAGSAKNIRYSLISETFNKNKVGKQTARYFVKYEINGKEYSTYVERQIEVKTKIKHPTFKFPDLVVKKGKTPNFKDAKITAGSAKNIRYSLISETFNKNKVGKQTVRYFVKYEINGKEYSTYVERQITVKK